MKPDTSKSNAPSVKDESKTLDCESEPKLASADVNGAIPETCDVAQKQAMPAGGERSPDAAGRLVHLRPVRRGQASFRRDLREIPTWRQPGMPPDGRSGPVHVIVAEHPGTIKPAPAVPVSDGFSPNQLRKLVRDVDARHVQVRELDGKKLSYIEGWYALSQANAIFGYAGWDREMVHFERVMERTRSDAMVTCGYMARVRIRVRAGSTQVIREGTGWGSAVAASPTIANERALKSAETDATKRALSTFGPSFGLTLYDKDHPLAKARAAFSLFSPDGQVLDDSLSPEAYCTGLRQLIEICRDTQQLDQLSRHNRQQLINLRAQAPALRNAQGVHFADLLLRLMQRRRERVALPLPGASPCKDDVASTGTGQVDHASSHESEQVDSNEAGGACLAAGDEALGDGRDSDPVCADSVEHCHHHDNTGTPTGGDAAEPLNQDGESATGETTSKDERTTLVVSEAATVASEPAQPNAPNDGQSTPSKIAYGAKIDKSKLPLGLERRIRDKDHLKRVAELPCLVCNRQPSHAHHLRFAQRRGMSQKVSDEYVVPLCALHHGDLHRSSNEQAWWERQGVEPIGMSNTLWDK